MADAVKDTINKVVEKVESVPVVKLTLTVDEAETLYEITQRIGGDRLTTRRKHTEAIGSALAHVGVRNPSPRPRVSNEKRSIHFLSPGETGQDDTYRTLFFNAYNTHDPYGFKRIA